MPSAGIYFLDMGMPVEVGGSPRRAFLCIQMHTNAYKYHHAVARSMTGLAAGGLARRPAARSITGLAADSSILISAYKLYLFSI